LTRDKSSFSQESGITADGVSSARLDNRSGMRALVSKLRTIRSRWHIENSNAKSLGVAEPELEFDSDTRLASVLAPILELLDETGSLTHDAALAQLQDEVGQLRGLVTGRSLRYKVVDALNRQVKRLPFLHRALKAPFSTRGPRN